MGKLVGFYSCNKALAMNKAGQAFISRKIPISELENALNHDTTNKDGNLDAGATAHEGAGDQ
jgi:hypothetical protein